MPKFQALHNIKDLIIPFVEIDAEGNITRDQSIVFNRGMNSARGFIPAYIHTHDQATVDHLRAYVGNKANGGQSFEEIIIEEPVKTLAPKAVKEDIAPLIAAEPQSVTVEEPKESSLKVYEDVTTVNEASQILLEMFEELVTRDVNTRAKIAAVAASKGLSFPNL